MQTPQQADSKHPIKSKTVWGIVVMVLGALATALGMGDADFTFLADGFQAADLGPLLVLVGYVVKEYGRRAATSPLKTLLGRTRRS